MYKIYIVVQGLKAYAISIYKDYWEDALDEAFFHIIENYDPTKGDLEHYAIIVVKTILLNRNKKEVADDDVIQSSADTRTTDDSGTTLFDMVVGKDTDSVDVEKCIIEMAPYFVKDFKFFKTDSPRDRRLSYTTLFEKYSLDCISTAKSYLLREYTDSVEDFYSFAKTGSMHSFSKDRYKKSLNTSVEFVEKINDIIVIKKKENSHIKRVFSFSIEDALETILDLFYSDDSKAILSIAGVTMYSTMAGKIVDSREELMKSLEYELIGSLLSRTSLKLFKYDEGEILYFSSIKDEQRDVCIEIFGKSVFFPFNRLVVKEVLC